MSSFTTVFTEKPSVAATVAAVVGANSRKSGYYEGNHYRVTWAFGHLVTTAEPEQMNPAWAGAWTMAQLPMIPQQWRYRVADKAQEQFDIIKSLFLDVTTTAIINAGDAGREGQLIFDLIFNLTGSTKPVQRLWTSSLTDEAIRAALQHLKPASAFANLSAAALLRQQWDWINGLSASRAYTIINSQSCPAGRVQTPTLALLVNRQATIDTFKPQTFYEIKAHVYDPPFKATYFTAAATPEDKPQTRLTDKAAADAILAQLAALTTATVRDLTTNEKKSNPPALFDLLALQKEANKRYGYTAKETLDLLQNLYEEHKIVSYPRTESRHISTDMLSELPAILQTLRVGWQESAHFALNALAQGHQLSKSYVDNTKLTDHHAIIPTSKHAPYELSAKHQNIYYLIVHRFLGIFLPPEIRDDTLVILDIGSHTFRAKGSVVKQPGWTVLDAAAPDATDPDDDDPNQQLPILSTGQTIPFKRAELTTGKTSPPKHYDDSSLLTAMKNAGQDIDDEDLAASMKSSGLGTPATRAAIIEKLLASGYAERKKKAILPTAKGKAFIGQVHPKLKDVALTASWEKQLRDIEDGSLTPQQADSSFISFINTIFPEIISTAPAPMPAAADPNAYGPCPQCKQGIVRQTPKGAGCSRYKEGCTFTIWGEINGKKLTPDQMRQLVAKLRTNLIKGFKKKDRSGTYDAVLFIDPTTFKVKFQFNNADKDTKSATGGA
jgi:DNA topoisomerase-3